MRYAHKTLTTDPQSTPGPDPWTRAVLEDVEANGAIGIDIAMVYFRHEPDLVFNVGSGAKGLRAATNVMAEILKESNVLSRASLNIVPKCSRRFLGEGTCGHLLRVS